MATQANASAKSGNFKSYFPYLVIPVLFVVAVMIFKFVFGNPANFADGDPTKDPIEGNYFGVIYKGGWIVPILLTMFFTVITFVIERFITLQQAGGKGNIDNLVRTLNDFLDGGNITGAIDWCDRQRGSVANIVRNGLEKYEEMSHRPDLELGQRTIGIQKEVEEATSLELPMLEKNLNILATIASIATLFGLLGTVLGMIKAFSALAHAGAPDASALATGISEALINTALGIGTSALAIIFYNFFTSRIDAMTYKIDEAGFALTTNFTEKHRHAGSKMAA